MRQKKEGKPCIHCIFMEPDEEVLKPILTRGLVAEETSTNNLRESLYRAYRPQDHQQAKISIPLAFY